MKTINDAKATENIIYNLSERGYSLTGVPDRGDHIGTEDLIISSLKCKKSRITLGLPIILRNNHANYDALKRLAVKEDVIQELGYVLDNALHLFYKNGEDYPQEKELKETIKFLRNNKDPTSQRTMIDIDSPGLERVLERWQSDLEKKWGVKGRITEEGFQHTYSTYKND